jgi:hypothetical protein
LAGPTSLLGPSRRQGSSPCSMGPKLTRESTRYQIAVGWKKECPPEIY